MSEQRVTGASTSPGPPFALVLSSATASGSGQQYGRPSSHRAGQVPRRHSWPVFFSISPRRHNTKTPKQMSN